MTMTRMKKRLCNSTTRGFPAFNKRETDGWRRSILFRGSTRNTDWLGIHMSELAGGHAPEPVVKHQEEELTVLLKGEVVIGLCDKDGSPEITREELLKPGSIIYHPSERYHYLENRSPESATYLAVKWHANIRLDTAEAKPGTSRIVEYSKVTTPGAETVFDAPTTWLDRLEIHASGLPAGDGYRSHVDSHDVVIVVLDGEVTFGGVAYPPGSCLLHPGGWKHGLRNASSVPAHYLVIELHGKPARHRPYNAPELTRDAFARTAANLGLT